MGQEIIVQNKSKRMTVEEKVVAVKNMDLMYTIWHKYKVNLPTIIGYTQEDWLSVWYMGYLKAVHTWVNREDLQNKYQLATIINIQCVGEIQRTLHKETGVQKKKSWSTVVYAADLVQHEKTNIESKLDSIFEIMICPELNGEEYVIEQEQMACYAHICNMYLTDKQNYVLTRYTQGAETKQIQKELALSTVQGVAYILSKIRQKLKPVLYDSVTCADVVSNSVPVIDRLTAELQANISEAIINYPEMTGKGDVLTQIAKNNNCSFWFVYSLWKQQKECSYGV